jgi:hypothetical protein
LCAVVLQFASLAAWAAPQPILETFPPDPPVTLRLEATFLGFAANCVPEFRVTVENLGTSDTFVPLGTLLNGGRRQIPDNLTFRLRERDFEGDQRTYGWQPYNVGGTVHDALVPLGAGSGYSMRLSANTFTTGSAAGMVLFRPPRDGAGYSFALRGKLYRDPEETLRILNPPVWQGELSAAEVWVPPCGGV